MSGTGQALDPVGEAVVPEPWTTASCVLLSATPDSEDVALVGHGLVDAADDRQAPVPDASAIGAPEAAASEPPPANCSVLSRSSDTNPPLDWTLHWLLCAAAVADTVHNAVKASSPTAAILVRPLIRTPDRPAEKTAVSSAFVNETGHLKEPCATP